MRKYLIRWLPNIPFMFEGQIHMSTCTTVYDEETNTHWAVPEGSSLQDIRDLIQSWKQNLAAHRTPVPVGDYLDGCQCGWCQPPAVALPDAP